MATPDRRGRYRGCLLGLAAGDAVGTTVEFCTRGTFKPVTDMVGGGPFCLKPGQWTDDTSMALCLAESLVEHGTLDHRDVMNRYLRWHDEGYMSSTGRCFDIGATVSRALMDYRIHGNPIAGSTHPHSAGNGSLMRLAPVPMFFAGNLAEAVFQSSASSTTTHGTSACVDACRLFGAMLVTALIGGSKDEILDGHERWVRDDEKIAQIASGSWKEKSRDHIRGTGYVVESLEAALWCFNQTASFRDAILTAVNLGDDADTTAAIVGQIAGAHYGMDAIPPHWVSHLAMRERITELVDRIEVMSRTPDSLTGGSGKQRPL